MGIKKAWVGTMAVVGMLGGCASTAGVDGANAGETTSAEGEGIAAWQSEPKPPTGSCPPVFKTWEDPNNYRLEPYKREGFFHAMSYLPEGPAIVAAGARIGEYCTFKEGNFHIMTTIKSSCATMPDGTTSCVGLCLP